MQQNIYTVTSVNPAGYSPQMQQNIYTVMTYNFTSINQALCSHWSLLLYTKTFGETLYSNNWLVLQSYSWGAGLLHFARGCTFQSHWLLLHFMIPLQGCRGNITSFKYIGTQAIVASIVWRMHTFIVVVPWLLYLPFAVSGLFLGVHVHIEIRPHMHCSLPLLP